MSYQPDLFNPANWKFNPPEQINPRTLAHRNDVETSKEAAENSEKFRSTHYAKILKALEEKPMGKDRISQATGLESIQVSRRLSDLLRLGKIERTGEKEKSKSGMRECVYSLKIQNI